MRSRVSILAGIVGVLLLSSSALAHHGAASLYDVNKETTLKVTITEFVWTNPHVEIGIASVENKSARWLLELGSPPNIANRGWTSKSLKVGDVVTVTFNPGLRGTRIGKLVKVVLRGRQGTAGMRAQRLLIVTAGLLAAAVAGCAGGSAPRRRPPPPRLRRPRLRARTFRGPGFTRAARAARRCVRPRASRSHRGPIEKMKSEKPTFSTSDFRETTDPAVLYADPNGYPRIQMHPMKFKLVQTDDYVYHLWEYNQNWRQIAINKEHSPDAPPTWYGNAVGKWEGDTLVVDSTGYKASTWLTRRASPIPRTCTSSSVSVGTASIW